MEIFKFRHISRAYKSEISPHDKFFSTYLICDICDKYEVWVGGPLTSSIYIFGISRNIYATCLNKVLFGDPIVLAIRLWPLPPVRLYDLVTPSEQFLVPLFLVFGWFGSCYIRMYSNLNWIRMKQFSLNTCDVYPFNLTQGYQSTYENQENIHQHDNHLEIDVILRHLCRNFFLLYFSSLAEPQQVGEGLFLIMLLLIFVNNLLKNIFRCASIS